VVALLVRRIGQLNDDLLCAARDAAKADREAVAAHDREHNAQRVAELFAYVRGDVVHRAVIAVRTRDDCFRHRDHIAVMQRKAVFLRRGQNRIRNDFYDVVALADDRRFDAS